MNTTDEFDDDTPENDDWKTRYSMSDSAGTHYVPLTSATGSSIHFYVDGKLQGPTITGVIRPAEPLFGTWLRDTLELQTEFYKDISNLPQDELEDWMRVNAFAAEDEIHEAMGEISWKTWTTSHFFNREAFIGEVVDALHFIGNMLAAAECTDAELNMAYLEKMARNRQRQRDGYTGTDKCSKCKRAADDVIAHGGYMKDWPDDLNGTGDVGYGCNQCFGMPGDECK